MIFVYKMDIIMPYKILKKYTKMTLRKKILIILCLIVYNLSFLLNYLLYFQIWDVNAEQAIQNTNIVAMFVDKKIYQDVSSDVERYAKTYIQTKLTNTKALVFPIDKNNFKAHDIYKILENLYLQWDKEKTTTLIWTVLIWDLPLPVVKRDWYVFPSIYPYVDFVDKKFVYNNSTKYFELNTEDWNGPEIWHWIINLWLDDKDYKKYFARLKTYNDNPTNYVEKKIWYDDFINMKNSFANQNLPYYLSNFVFLEDLAYHRYNTLMLSLFNQSYTDSLQNEILNFSDTLDSLSEQSKTEYENADSQFDSFKDISSQYYSKAQEFRSNYMTDEFTQDVSSSYSKTPTLLLSKSIEPFLKKYNELFWNDYYSTLKDNILATWRWDIEDIDTHATKTFIKDEISKNVLVEYNRILEEALDSQIQEKWFYMKIPVLQNYEDYKVALCTSSSTTNSTTTTTSKSWVKYLDSRYENFYFGKYAWNITWAQDFSIYMWTYKNLTWYNQIKSMSYSASDIDDLSLDANNKSVWASYWIMKRQIEANRWYNFMKAEPDWTKYQSSRCSNWETLEQRASRNRWSASPLNYEHSSNTYQLKLKSFDYKQAWNPTSNVWVWWSLWDIAGSKLISTQDWDAYGYKWYSKYASVIQTKQGWVSWGWGLSWECPTPTVSDNIYCWTDKTILPYSQVEFPNIFAAAWPYSKITVNGSKTKEIYHTCTLNTINSSWNEWWIWTTSQEYEISWTSSKLCNSPNDCNSIGEWWGLCPEYKYDDFKYYNYGLVDSRVYHKNPTWSQIAWMNSLTLERPIDDPRYISFKWVWWDEVDLVYPNLLNIEVYKKNSDRLDLKSYDEIKQSVKDYLINKVKKYNESLLLQQQKSAAYYNTAKDSFDFLWSVDTVATPNRNYTLLDDNYFIAILWDANIDRIASSLYYVNNMWTERTYSNNVSTDINLISSQADINKKIKSNTQTYLRSDSSQDQYLNPWYQANWYEVWVINSDWIDTVFSGWTTWWVPDLISKIDASKINASYYSSDVKNVASLNASANDSKCWVWADWSVMIWQWPSSFSCWMATTLATAASVRFDYSCSKSNVLRKDEDDYSSGPKSSFNSIFGTGKFYTWTSLFYSWYLRDSYQTFSSKYATVNSSDKLPLSTSWTNYLSTRNLFMWKDYTVNNQIYTTYSPSQKEEYDNIQNSVKTTISDTPSVSLQFVEDDGYNKYLTISALQDLWTLDATIALIWDNCFQINGVDACKRNIDMSFNPYISPQLIPLNFSSKASWTSIVQLKICKSWTNICYNKNHNIGFSPADLQSLELYTPTDRVIKWGQLPMALKGYDKYWNSIWQTMVNYNITVDKWELNYYSDLQKEYTFTDLKQAYFMYDSNLLSWVNWDAKDTISVSVDSSFSWLMEWLPSLTKDILLVDGNVSINNWWKIVSNIDYNLPESLDEMYINKWNWIVDLDLSKLVSLDLKLVDNSWVALSSPAVIYSENWLLIPWTVSKEILKYIDWDTKYYEKSQFNAKYDYIVKDWKLNFVLHPNFKAWEDVLVVSIPWLSELRIPIKVNPSSAKSVDIVFAKNDFNLWDKPTGDVYLKDVWWNTVFNVDKNIVLWVIWNSSIDWQKLKTVTTSAWKASFQVVTKDPGWKVYVYGYIEWSDLEKYAWDYFILNVKNIDWPKEKMNVMYLNLFWSDWWNLWWYFSENKWVAKQVINNSDKVLALTTQLMSPKNIKSLSFIVAQDLRVFNTDWLDANLSLSWWNLSIELGTYPDIIWNLNLWKLSTYSLKILDKVPEFISENSLYYIPQPLDTRIKSNLLKDNKLYINDQEIIDFANSNIWDGVTISLSENLQNWYNLWSVEYNGIVVWDIVLYRNDDQIIWAYPSNLSTNWWYESAIVFWEWTTNWKLWVWIYKEWNTLDNVAKSFTSIEDATDPSENIWFKASFRNINDFANWQTVWQATKAFQSEYEINYWDPVLTRISINPQVTSTNYDLWMWERVYSLPWKTIVKSIDIDFNNDWFKDLVIAYSDWTIRLLKNYWWNQPFVDIGELVVISDWISDLYSWDVDKNWFQDLIVKTKDNKLRAYSNKNWIFDIDWKIVCLDVAQWPEKFDWVYQIFVKDMNLDGGVDIITYDVDGNIKIFYGGTDSSNGDYYISSLNYKCDNSWSTRQKDHSRLVKNYGLQLLSWEKIYDDSLVHWKWLSDNATGYDSLFASWDLKNITPDSSIWAVSKAYSFKAKVQSMPINYLPTYESGTWDSVAYNKIIYLTWSDPISVTKTYSDLNWWKLISWDPVRIDVVITWNTQTTFTYLDHLTWPWEIYREDETQKIDWFDNWTLPSDVVFNRQPSNWYQFMIDNININSRDVIKFSYTVWYVWMQIVKIDVDTFTDDKYPDIKVYPNDWCVKCTFLFEAIDDAKNYKETKNDFSGQFQASLTTLEWNTQTFYEDIKAQVEKVITGWNMTDLTALNVTETWSDSSMFQLKTNNNSVAIPTAPANISTTVPSSSSAWFIETNTSWMWSIQDLWWWMDANVSLFNSNYDALTSQINNVLRGLCKWFKFGKENCEWMNSPSNMSFFAPWYNNMMGCPTWYDDWKPFFRFPSTKWQSCKWNPCCIPLPVPNQARLNGIDNPNTKCCAPCPWIYPSNIRLYLAPTLTMWLGFAACFGPYKPATVAPPAPFWTVAWNCVVTASTFQWAWKCSTPTKDTEYVITNRQQESIKLWSCNNMYYSTNRRYTPFAMYSSDSEEGLIKSLDIPSFAKSAFGMNWNPRNVSSKAITFDKVYMKWWEPIQLKIEWASAKWLIDCIIKKWIDKQIRYIINNLTGMTIYIYLPDVSSLWEWFDKLKMSNVTKIREQLNSDFDWLKNNWNKWKWAASGDNAIDEFSKEYLPAKSAFKKASDTFSNPFSQIENLLENVALFKVTTKNIRIQVPVIYQEDILKYSKYLKAWMARQSEIIKEWEDVWNDLLWKCNEIEDEARREDCKRSAETYFDFSINWKKLINSVKKNIQILWQYMQFPFKLYDWIHSSDKYLSELICIIEKFFKSVIWWLKQMANRFEKWVDFIILLIWIIETWQILIDFSVKWRSSCAKCRQDNYDQYTCALSLLCVDLPVLPIPPFKLPDIYLDFSHIDLWIEVILPKFVFSPMALSLPRIPDLPSPPKLWLGTDFDFTLPAIPLLPELPEFPELPSFLPTIKFDLPLLPPAPKIPPLIPEIRIILEIAQFIWRLYCIIKSWIWLVAEWNVKARIEQLTQRTNRIFPFDFMQLTFVDPPLAWNDLRVDAYLKMKFEFDDLYQFAKSVWASINQSTWKVVQGFTETSRSSTSSMNSSKDGVQWKIDSWKSVLDKFQDELKKKVEDKVNWGIKDLFNFNESLYFTWGMEYKQAYNKLKSELTYMKNSDKDEKRKLLLWKTLDLIDMDKQVSPNVSWVEKLQTEITNYINLQRSYYDDLSDKIKNDYNWFLDEISKDTLVSSDEKTVEFNTNLFNWNEKLKDILKNQEHPYRTYLDLNYGLVDWFRKTLASKSASDLNMTDSTYTRTKMYLDTVANEVNSARSNFEDKKSMHEWVLLADNNVVTTTVSTGDAPTISTPTYDQIYSDPTQFINWFFVRWSTEDYYNVINRQDKGSTAYKNDQYTITDMNNDGKKDILWWDSNSVFVKYWDQNNMYSWTVNVNYRDYYQTQVFDSPQSLKENVDENWYYKIWALNIKIWDSSTQTENFKRSGQSYETISFSWSNDLQKNVWWYLIQLIQRADVFQDKWKQMDYYSTQTLDTKYVLVVPENFDEASQKIYSKDEISEWFIYDYVKSWLISSVVKTNLDEDSLSLALSNLPRKWYYARIVWLSYDKSANLLSKQWPWSDKSLAWAQLRSDKQTPALSIKLVREKTWQVEWEWNNLKWYINTSYKLDAKWQDNGYITNSFVEYSGSMLKEMTWSDISIEWLYFTGVQTREYNFISKDHAWNSNTQKVLLNIEVPNININSIQTSPLWWKVTALLSHDIDDWVVKFERLRDGIWSSLTWITNNTNITNFNIWYNQNYATWWVFDLSNKISLYDNTKVEIWFVDVDSWKIVLNDSYKDKYQIKVDFKQNTWLIKIIDKSTNMESFILYLKSKNLISTTPINILNGDYQLVSISTSMLWEFQWWYCIMKKWWECSMFVSPKWAIYVPSPMNTELWWEYSYDDTNSYVIYKVYDLKNSPLFEMKFIPESFRK